MSLLDPDLLLPPELRRAFGLRAFGEMRGRPKIPPEERAEKLKIKERRKAERDRKRDLRRKARR